jgi:hypothetical protein
VVIFAGQGIAHPRGSGLRPTWASFWGSPPSAAGKPGLWANTGSRERRRVPPSPCCMREAPWGRWSGPGGA